MTHAELVERAARWLARRRNRNRFVLTEYRTHNGGESPDVIAWQADGASTVLECKVSRADFLADKKKLYLGMGMWRYYFCLPGVARPDEVPRGWGLYELAGRKVGLVIPAPKRIVFDFDGERLLLLNAARRASGYKIRPALKAFPIPVED